MVQISTIPPNHESGSSRLGWSALLPSLIGGPYQDLLSVRHKMIAAWLRTSLNVDNGVGKEYINVIGIISKVGPVPVP